MTQQINGTGGQTFAASTKILAEGTEGGQLLFEKGSASALFGDVAVDIVGTSLRIFETGQTNRGVNINLANALGGANDKLPLLSEFPLTKAANGYQKLPSGLIIQWGTVTATLPAAPTPPSIQAFTFPIAFPVNCASITGTFSAGVGEGYLCHTIESVNLSGATIRAQKGSGTSGTIPFQWIAIGY